MDYICFLHNGGVGMMTGYEVRQKNKGRVTLVIFLAMAAGILLCCFLFIQNYLVFTPDGVRLDLFGSTSDPVESVDTETEAAFSPKSEPKVDIEDTQLPPAD